MRVHGDNIIRRRTRITGLRHYREAKEQLREDFSDSCGYCGKIGNLMYENFQIDHFVPKSLDPDKENDYYNLVWACPKCNLSKSNKWPTGDIKKPHDGKKGIRRSGYRRI